MKIIVSLALVAALCLGFFFLGQYWNKNGRGNIDITPTPSERTLDKYTFDNLESGSIKPGNFRIIKEIQKNEFYTSNLFEFEFSPSLDKTNKKTTGVINIPAGQKGLKFPLVFLIRGYVDQNIYNSGDGTRKAAEVFAKNGFITVAPDFLGYGESDSESGNILESRFQTYVTVISLLNSLDQITVFDNKNTFIWGHSNGGHIALAVLEITQKSIPTVFWAPVSKPFPFSVLYYTDDSEDKGKFLRGEISAFEKLYNSNLYSIDNYFDKIIAPIQLHQGTNDDAVPVYWSDSLYQTLKNRGKSVEYLKHVGADHNMTPLWNEAVNESLEFFKKHFTE